MDIKAFLEHVYRGKFRKTGEKMVTHPFAVRDILMKAGVNDEATLTAALLHDVLEDSSVGRAYICYRFGEPITNIVELLSKEDTWKTAYVQMKNRMDEMELAWAEYPEAVLIKMADRLHNLQTIRGFTIPKQKEYIEETKSILLPLFKSLKERNKLADMQKSVDILYEQLQKETKKIEKRLLNS